MISKRIVTQNRCMQEYDNSAGNELLSYRLFELKESITKMKTEKQYWKDDRNTTGDPS